MLFKLVKTWNKDFVGNASSNVSLPSPRDRFRGLVIFMCDHHRHFCHWYTTIIIVIIILTTTTIIIATTTIITIVIITRESDFDIVRCIDKSIRSQCVECSVNTLCIVCTNCSV